MQVGDIYELKISSKHHMIITKIDYEEFTSDKDYYDINSFCAMWQDGGTLEDYTLETIDSYNLISSNNGDLKTGMLEFVEKYLRCP